MRNTAKKPGFTSSNSSSRSLNSLLGLAKASNTSPSYIVPLNKYPLSKSSGPLVPTESSHEIQAQIGSVIEGHPSSLSKMSKDCWGSPLDTRASWLTAIVF